MMAKRQVRAREPTELLQLFLFVRFTGVEVGAIVKKP